MDLSRQGASFDMHHDLFRSIRDLDLRSNFNLFDDLWVITG